MKSGFKSFVWVLLVLGSAGFVRDPERIQGQSDIRWATAPSVTKEELANVRELFVMVSLAGAVGSQVAEDALAVELMAGGFAVVSRERWAREERRQLEAADAKAGEDPESTTLIDILDVTKACGADAILSVSVLAELVQKNVYGGDQPTVDEVRSVEAIRSAAATLVRVEDGKLMVAGSAEFENPPSVIALSRMLGQGLIEQLK